MSPSRPIVVSGLGVVAAGGVGEEELARALASGRAPLRPVQRLRRLHPPDGPVGAVTLAEADLSPWLTGVDVRRSGRPSRLAVAAGRMALDRAGLASGAPPGSGIAVFLATAYGPSDYSERILQQIAEAGPEAVSPFLFTESVANAPAAQLALAIGATGANITFTQREAGPLIALGRAAREIARGGAERVLVGSVDELTPLLHGVLGRFGALARPDAGGRERALPYERRRDGYLAGEGAAVVVLERAEAADSRGVRSRARVVAFGSAFDPEAPASGWGADPRPLARLLRSGLERAGVDPAEIVGVIGSGCGSVAGDRLEALILHETFPDGPPPLVAPKAVTGEVGAALLAAPPLAFGGTIFGMPEGFEHPDPELGITPYVGALPPGALLVTASAVGGAFAWVVLGAPEET